MAPKAIITAVTGIQAAALARAFQAAGYAVTGQSRKPPASPIPGITHATADPEAPGALEALFEGAVVVCVTAPIDHRPGARQRFAARIAEAAGRAGVGRIVFNTAAVVWEEWEKPTSAVLREMRSILSAGPVPVNVVQPTVYMDNLVQPWAADAMLAKGLLLYSAVPEAPIAWISHRSLGDFCVAAARIPTTGRVFDVGGPQNLTGPEVAAILSRRLGRPLTYTRLPPAGFAAALNAAYGAPAGDEIAELYNYLEAHPTGMSRDPAAYAELGVQPETLESWAARTSWPGHPAG